MPFYGTTPADAAHQLCEWLTRAHARAREAVHARCRIWRHEAPQPSASCLMLVVLAAASDARLRPPQFQQRQPDFDRQLEQQAETDKTWRAASDGFMQMDKITYRSRAGDLDIPAFVFQPLKLRGAKGIPRIVWVHENIRGHLYEHYIPYIREATAKGYVVIAPEYRGSIGYGKAFYDAIDYGGTEVDDVVTAVEVLKTKYPQVDPSRIGIIGWSHGGMITLLSIFRNPALFKAAVAMVPVTNLFQRLAWKGVERQHQAIDPAEPLRRPAVRAPRHLQGSLAALQRRQAADSALRRRDEERRGREHRRGHAAGRRAARAQAAARRDDGLRQPAGRPHVRPPRGPEDVAAGEHARAARFVEPRLDLPRLEPGSLPRAVRRHEVTIHK